MPITFTDRELLYGILATQMGLVAREALVAAVRARTAGEDGLLGEILLRQQAFSAETKQLVDALVEQHLALHDNDTARSLASLSTVGSLGDELKTLGVPEIDAGLDHLTLPLSTLPQSTLPLGAESSKQDDSPSVETSRFRVLKMHAKGGIGQVSLARDGQLSREVALKELQPRYADDPGSRHRFVLEAEVTGGLEHPGIVPVYGAGQYADGRPFYAMRFIRGDSLKDATAAFHQRMAKGPQQEGYELELRKLLQRFIDVCEAMEYAHSRGVLHRDLKPGNIMLGRYGETLVVDWGLAKIAKDGSSEEQTGSEAYLQPASADETAATRMGSTIGTPNYMSPEQAAGEIDKLGAASDVYSLGATLYQVLTGQPPFQGNDVGVILAGVQGGVFPKPREINPRVARSLEAICLRAMALAPADRYASAQALAEDVERHLADEPVLARPDSPLQSVQRWARRHRGATLAAATGVVLLAIVSAVSFFAVRSQRDEAERQRDRAVTSEQSAQENFTAAEAARALAEEQQAVAEEQREIAGRMAYNSTISEASRLVGTDPMMARFLLEDEQRCPPERRDFLWHLLHKQVVRERVTVPLKNQGSFAVAYSQQGDVVAIGGLSNKVELRDAKDGSLLQVLETEFETVTELHFSLDGKQLAVVLFDSIQLEENQEAQHFMFLELWNLNSGERILKRERQESFSSRFWVQESGFSTHLVVSESYYSSSDPNYSRDHAPPFDVDGQQRNRWFRLTSYDVQTEEVTEKYICPSEDTTVVGEFQVLPPLLTCECKTESGYFIWIYDIRSEQARSIPMDTLAFETWSFPLAVERDFASFLLIGITEDITEKMDSWFDLETAEFEADVSFQKVDFQSAKQEEPVPLGRFQSGMFIESRRVQFEATDKRGKTLAMLLDRRPLIQVVDLTKPDLIHSIPAHRGDVVSVAMSPDGTQLVSTGLDQELRFWDVKQITAEREIIVPALHKPKRLLLSPTSDEVLVLGLMPIPETIDPNSGEPIEFTYDPNEPPEPYFQMQRFRISDGAPLGTQELPTPPERNFIQRDGGIGGLFGALGEGMTNMLAGLFEIHPVSTRLTEMDFSPDGKQLVIANNDRLLTFDLSTNSSDELWGPHYPDFQQRENISQTTVSDDLRYFVTLTLDTQRIRVYDFASRELYWELPKGEDKAFQIHFVPNSHSLAVFRETAGATPEEKPVSLETWDLDEKTSQRIVLPRLHADDDHYFFPYGKQVLIHRDFARQAMVVDVESSEIKTVLDLGRDVPLGMFPESDLLMLATEAGLLNFWDIELGQYRAALQVVDGVQIQDIAVSRDQKTLMILGKDKTLRFLGVDRLRDDLADVHALMQHPPAIVDGKAETEAAAEQTEASDEQDATTDSTLPQFEFVDEMPRYKKEVPDVLWSDPNAPVPPAPAVEPAAPPAPAIDPSA